MKRDSIRILIVEDNVITAESVRSTLVGLGYEVPATAASGLEAVRKAWELRPDLILMDIKLQGEMDGVAAVERIHSRLDVPVVYLTAFADDETLQRAKSSEPFGYVLKPFRVGNLHGAIEVALYKHGMERKLKDSEARYRKQTEFLNTILESLTYPFYVVDVNDYTIQMANSAAAMNGFSGWATCYALSHGRSSPCGLASHPCPLDQIKETKEPVMVEHVHYDQDGNARYVEVHGYPLFDKEGNVVHAIEYTLDITERKQVEEEREKLLSELQEALARVKKLSGLLPICASCKKIRDDQGYWTQVEVYIHDHSDARFTHGLCPECAQKLYPDYYQDDE